MLRLVKYYLKFKSTDGAAGTIFEFSNYKLKSENQPFRIAYSSYN